MIQTFLIGYGQFHLDQLLPGEEFARYDGSRAKIDPLTPPLGDYLTVWIDLNTSNARRVLLHRHALVHAWTAEQARMITARTIHPKGGLVP
jgi:hypothetical protein